MSWRRPQCRSPRRPPRGHRPRRQKRARVEQHELAARCRVTQYEATARCAGLAVRINNECAAAANGGPARVAVRYIGQRQYAVATEDELPALTPSTIKPLQLTLWPATTVITETPATDSA